MTTASQKTRVSRDVPPMASRHFWFIADTLHEQMDDAAGDAVVQMAITATAKRFANRLHASNGSFDRDRFLMACGVTNA